MYFVLLLLIILAYLFVVRRLNAALKNARLVLDPKKDCLQLTVDMTNLVLPITARAALEVSLLRTFAIPSISKLLAATRQFEKEPGKRYEDTELIIREIVEHAFNSERSDKAIRRLNFIHGHYKISNDDFLYVLSTFCVAPTNFVKRFEWTPLELHDHYKLAGFYTWRKIGKRMGIKGIPKTYDELDRWAEEYERKYMVFADTNRAVADAAYVIFERWLPWPVRPFLRPFSSAVFDDRMRHALGYPKPAAPIVALVHFLLKVRSFLAWKLLPPRPEWLHHRRTPKDADADGFYHPLYTKYNVNVYCPRGYKIEDLGPAHVAPGKLSELHAGS
eukprot:TRINITY_DN5599_c2_g1_i1.p1 TRINITY_DN5599_c2_g1~~TRINITY_DN5599_c2_g1_i1.p1  ORF type:complete len:332 (+),score=90.51 TRINITY_DN5599_c2_g1_i1:114-1109(+)